MCAIKLTAYVFKAICFYPFLKALHPFYGTSADSTKPDQTPQNVASDQVMHCFLAGCTLKNLNEIEAYYPATLNFHR